MITDFKCILNLNKYFITKFIFKTRAARNHLRKLTLSLMVLLIQTKQMRNKHLSFLYTQGVFIGKFDVLLIS